MGYDYVPIWIGCRQEDPRYVIPSTNDTAILLRGKRSWTPMKDVVKTKEDYENFSWPDPEEVMTDSLDIASSMLPGGMRIIVNLGSIFEPVTQRILGVDTLSRYIYRNQDLVRDVCARLGEASLAATSIASERDEAGALTFCDDMGVQSPDFYSSHLPEGVLPVLAPPIRASSPFHREAGHHPQLRENRRHHG